MQLYIVRDKLHDAASNACTIELGSLELSCEFSFEALPGPGTS